MCRKVAAQPVVPRRQKIAPFGWGFTCVRTSPGPALFKFPDGSGAVMGPPEPWPGFAHNGAGSGASQTRRTRYLKTPLVLGRL